MKQEQPIVETETYLFSTWIKGTEIVKTEKGDITVLEILNDFRSHLLQNLDHNKEAYHQKQCDIPVVSKPKGTVCKHKGCKHRHVNEFDGYCLKHYDQPAN